MTTSIGQMRSVNYLPKGKFFQEKWLTMDREYNSSKIKEIIQNIWTIENLDTWCDPCHIFRYWRLVQLYIYSSISQSDSSPWVNAVKQKKSSPKIKKLTFEDIKFLDEKVLNRLTRIYSTPETAFQNREEIWVALSFGNHRIGNIDEMVLADEILRKFGKNHSITKEFRKLAHNAGDIYITNILDCNICVPFSILDMNNITEESDVENLEQNRDFLAHLGRLSLSI